MATLISLAWGGRSSSSATGQACDIGRRPVLRCHAECLAGRVITGDRAGPVKSIEVNGTRLANNSDTTVQSTAAHSMRSTH